MSLRLIKRADSPGLTYVNPETGHKQFAWDMKTLMLLVEKYRRDNGFLPVEREQVEDQICQMLPPGWCEYTTGGQPNDFVDVRIGKDDVLRGTRVLSEIAVRRAASVLVPSWTPFVEQEEAERRAAICAACYAKVSVEGCVSCDDYIPVISAVIGDRTTKADAQLGIAACAICKCAARAHVHVKADVLSRGVDDAMLAKFKLVEPCWKWRVIEEYRLTESAPTDSPTP